MPFQRPDIRASIRLPQAIAGVILGSTLLTQTPVLAAPAKTAPNRANYEKAQKELPKDIYLLYRIVERTSRANGLDERPWRIGIVPKYEINAFATDVNLIAMYTGILDQLAGDSSAIACIVGHEMAHNVKRHVALGAAQKAEMIAKIKKETEEEVMREINSAKSTATATSILGGLAGIFGGTAGAIGGSVLQGAGQQRLAGAQAKIDEIVKKKSAELDTKLAEQGRTQEFEADQLGYAYIAKAGFEPEGCLRAMEVLARTPGAEFDTSHPSVPKRIEGLKQLIVKQPPSKLAAEGKTKIDATAPLPYALSEDKMSLRIESRFTKGGESDIDRLFGK
jgi:beta-barrel assembly-enhancing protease